MVDGTIVRQGTGNTHPDSPDFPQCRPCIKGMSTRRIVTAPERLKYPMKRKHWQPGGTDYHPEMRGVDEWERISWDEATDIIASELLRVRDTYGNRSFLALGELEPRLGGGLHGSPILNALGGCLTTWGQASQGGFPVVAKQMRGAWSSGVADSQDRMALRHSKLIVFWGTNPAWTALGRQHVPFPERQEGRRQDRLRRPLPAPVGPGHRRRMDPLPPGHRRRAARGPGLRHDRRGPAGPGVPGHLLPGL